MSATATEGIRPDHPAPGEQLGPPGVPPATRGRQVPSIGRIVHYYAFGTPGGEYAAGELRAAIVTEVNEPGNPESAVGLAVLNPTGLFFNRNVAYSSEPKGGCWGWPPFVPPAG